MSRVSPTGSPPGPRNTAGSSPCSASQWPSVSTTASGASIPPWLGTAIRARARATIESTGAAAAGVNERSVPGPPGGRHAGAAVVVGPGAEDLVDPEAAVLEADGRSRQVQPPHPGPALAGEGDGPPPVGPEVGQPGPQGAGVVPPPRFGVAHLEPRPFHGQDDLADVEHLPVGEDVAGHERPLPQLRPADRGDGVVEQVP